MSTIKVKYLFGGGNMIGWAPSKFTPLFCKEVEVIDKDIGNSQNKVWIITEKGEQKVRAKVLADTWLEAYQRFGNKMKDIKPEDNVSELIDYMNENHSEYLV